MEDFEPINIRGFSDDDLHEAIKVAVDEIKRRAFRRGEYSVEQRLKENHKDYEKTLQERRDHAVGRAKEDLSELETTMAARVEIPWGNKSYQNLILYVEFVVNRGKRTVVALVHGERTGRIHEKGIAKCAPEDCFNEHLGKVIALRRALGLNIPALYLNAPQPTEIHVGDVIKYDNIGAGTTNRFAVIRTDGETIYYDDGEHESKNDVDGKECLGVIVTLDDDSNSERGE